MDCQAIGLDESLGKTESSTSLITTIYIFLPLVVTTINSDNASVKPPFQEPQCPLMESDPYRSQLPGQRDETWRPINLVVRTSQTLPLLLFKYSIHLPEMAVQKSGSVHQVCKHWEIAELR